jgi:hypothetical protein
MKIKLIPLTFLASVSIAAGTAHAQSIPEPVLNIQAGSGNGRALDTSERARDLPDLGAGSNSFCVALPSENAIEIPYAEGDPLFSTAEFTWILRAKFANPAVPKAPAPVMGRWVISANDRSAAMLLGSDQLMKFAISSDGTYETTRSESLTFPIPADNWRIFTFRWKAGEMAALSLFSNEGKLLQNHKMAAEFILPSIKQVTQPFLVGAPPEYGMEIKAVKVFNRALTDEELTPDVLMK